MKQKLENNDSRRTQLDQLIGEITVDAYGDDEQLWAFRQAFEDSISVPCDGFVIGEPVLIVAFGYDGNERRGLTARCRLLGSDRVITLRASRLWDVVPGEIAVVKPRKQWSYAGHPYLSGEIESTRRDVAALGLVPLKLEDRGSF